MKLLKAIVTATALLSVLVSCGPEDNNTETVELKGAVISGADTPLEVDLDAPAALDLIWAAGSWTGEGMITYSVVIDKAAGDFSNPIKVLNPVPGTLSVSVSVSDLNAIFAACAANEEAETADAKWAVVSAAGGKTETSSPQTIKMHKSATPPGPAPVAFELGTSVFAAGAGALESGQQMTYVAEHPFNKDGAGFQDNLGGGLAAEYEFFTKIEADKDFYLTYGSSASEVDGYITFNTATLNAPIAFDASNDAPTEGFKATETSVYRIRIDVTAGKILVQKVGDVAIRAFGRDPNANGKYAIANTTDLPMEYQGNGVWKATDVVIKWGGDTYAGRFDTYKFNVILNESNNQLYGAFDSTIADDANPTNETPAKYWALQPTQGGGLRSKGSIHLPAWLLNEEKNSAFTADVTLYLNFSKGDYYFHEFSNEKAYTAPES